MVEQIMDDRAFVFLLIIAALVGYIVGLLQSAALDRRERREARRIVEKQREEFSKHWQEISGHMKLAAQSLSKDAPPFGFVVIPRTCDICGSDDPHADNCPNRWQT